MSDLWVHALYVVYFWSACAVAGGPGPTYYKETILEASTLTADEISIYVHSSIPGNLTWRFTNADHVGISVTTITDAVEEIGRTRIDLQSNASHVSLHIGAKQPTSVAATGTGSRTLCSDIYAVLVMWTVAVVYNWRHTSLILVIILANGVWRGQADDIGYELPTGKKRVSIELRVPRRYRLGDVYLLINGGVIRVDVTSGAGDISNFTCSTGYGLANVCAGCCHGNGYCSNNTCVCEDGYDPQTDCKSKQRKYTLFSHPLDPRLVGSLLPNGDSVLIQETFSTNTRYNDLQRAKPYKTYTGTATSKHLHMTTVTDSYSNNLVVIFNSSGVLSEIRIHEDAVYSIRFVENCDLTIGINSDFITVGICMENVGNQVEDGATHEPTTHDSFSNNIDSISPLRHIRKERKKQPDSRRKRKRNRKRTRTSSRVDIPASVHRCGGGPAVDHVTVRVTPATNNGSSVTLTAIKDTSTDKFMLRLPNVSVPVPDTVFNNKCQHVLEKSARVCSRVNRNVLEAGCDRLSQWISGVYTHASHVTRANFTTSVNTCSYIYNTIDAFCDIFIHKPTNTDNETCFSRFTETVNIFKHDLFYLFPTVLFTDGKIIEGPRQIISLKSLTNLTTEILIEDDTPLFTIKSLSVLPKDPVPQDIYRVILEYECSTSQTIVIMNITGSDLYRNHATCHGVTACQCCILHVAGATDAVIDHVTIHVSDPSTNTNISKDMIVTF